ncbi:hypothetical protein F4780DRAFT_738156 [Xylariomycetidae sp. FL0641]|nr:hypothetical protein F4780DRAFT_738156 [Xylariomycetidae sp. FL0641]
MVVGWAGWAGLVVEASSSLAVVVFVAVAAVVASGGVSPRTESFGSLSIVGLVVVLVGVVGLLAAALVMGNAMSVLWFLGGLLAVEDSPFSGLVDGESVVGGESVGELVGVGADPVVTFLVVTPALLVDRSSSPRSTASTAGNTSLVGEFGLKLLEPSSRPSTGTMMGGAAGGKWYNMSRSVMRRRSISDSEEGQVWKKGIVVECLGQTIVTLTRFGLMLPQRCNLQDWVCVVGGKCFMCTSSRLVMRISVARQPLVGKYGQC